MMTALTEHSVTDMLPCHAKEVAEIEKEAFSEPWSEKALLDSLDKGIFLVFLENDSVLGYAGAYCVGDEAAVTNVAVKAERRGEGIGKTLVESLIRRAEALGLDKISLEVRVSNTPAIKLYEKLGFETAGVRKNFYSSPREDAFVLIHNLQRK